jgi:phosphoglycolate phosphatase
MPIKLLIFDLDGTLVDTARDITEALNHAIRPRGLRPMGVEEVKALIGEGTTRLIEKALAPLGEKLDEANDETVKAVLKSFLDYYSENLAVHSSLYPNVRETLRKLRAFDRAVLSNKREDLSRRLLEDLGVAGEFTLIAGSDTSSSKKPSPEPVRYVLDKTGVRAEEALMIGDSPYDVEAAKGAGVKTAAVTYGYRDRALLKDANYMIDNMGELLPLLAKLEALKEDGP